MLTFRDVTDFVNLQDQLRRARTLEAMGSLVAGVAHEVRNPLFSISATVDTLEAELGPRPEFAEYAALLRSQVGRLTQLMRDLLDYGKPSLLQRAPTRLPDVAAARPALLRHPGPRPAGGAGGAGRRRAALRWTSTAAGWSRPSRTSSPTPSSTRPPDPWCAREWPPPSQGSVRSVRLTIEDEGPGLPEGDLSRIFEPFFSRRKGGTGLGLSIVQRVAEAHGGSISAENRHGGGACFTLLLPVARSTEGSLG